MNAFKEISLFNGGYSKFMCDSMTAGCNKFAHMYENM